MKRPLVVALLLNSLWIHASEVARYFLAVMPRLREELPGVPGVAPMNLGVFLVWGLWDCLLIVAVTGFTWLWLDRFGSGRRQAVAAGTCAWLAIFGILWLGLYNMRLASMELMGIALPLAWLELAVAALIVDAVRPETGDRRPLAAPARRPI